MTAIAAYTPTPEQVALLAHDPAVPARVLAGSGTGKSATLVALVEKLLGQAKAPRVKLLTFTRAATAELAEKVSEHASTATEPPSTIHSFAFSVLLQNPGAGNFPEPLRTADDWEHYQVVLPTLRSRSGIKKTRLKYVLIPELASNSEALTEGQDPRVSPEERAHLLGVWHEHRRIYGYTLLSELPYALHNALVEHRPRDKPFVTAHQMVRSRRSRRDARA